MSESTPRKHMILVVEDEYLIRELLMDHLSDVGFEVRCAANADEARDILLTGEAIELVLADINMPGSMDGAQLARWLQLRRPDMPVILLSGKAYCPSNIAEKRWFFRKPFELVALEAHIRQVLD